MRISDARTGLPLGPARTRAGSDIKYLKFFAGGDRLAISLLLAAQLLGKLTAPSQAEIKAETRMLVQEALNSMAPIDREVLALKHFEQLSTTEIAEILGLSKAGAGSRYLRNQAPARDSRANSRVYPVMNSYVRLESLTCFVRQAFQPDMLCTSGFPA